VEQANLEIWSRI